MPSKYRYTAISEEGKKLTGEVDAPGVVTARQNLEKLGLKVERMEKVLSSMESKPESKNKFKFLAIDKDGKKIMGSVFSVDRLAAYVTLTTKYKFE